MAQLNNYGVTPKYNKDEYLKKLIPLVIKNAPEFDNFSIFDLHEDLNLNKNDKIIFKDLSSEIRINLVERGIVKMYGSSQVKLTDDGRDKKNGTEPGNRISKYQKIYLALFICFSLSTMFFAYSNYSSNNRNELLQTEIDSLKAEYLIYKDSVAKLKSKVKLYQSQSIIDTSQTKNHAILKSN
jgi:hypothetical protein